MTETTLTALQTGLSSPNSPRDIHQAIIALGDVQALLDSIKITLYKSLNQSRQAQTVQATQEN